MCAFNSARIFPQRSVSSRYLVLFLAFTEVFSGFNEYLAEYFCTYRAMFHGVFILSKPVLTGIDG